MARAHSFEPIVDTNIRVLILGTLPGKVSLEAGQYYAHPRNAFWRLTGAVIGVELADLPYKERLDELNRAGVGLWDVISSAERDGSLDQNIRNPEWTDLPTLIESRPRLRAVAFNGGKAAAIGRRQLAGLGFEALLIDLPSSSPAHARPFEEKLRRWSVLAQFLADSTDSA